MKKAANLSVDVDLLQQAKELKINLSQTFEEALRQKIRAHEGEKWREENREALKSYNRWVEKNGLFSDGLRRF